MSIFSGINNVSITGSRPQNLREGEYVLGITSSKAFISRKGHDSVVFEFRVHDAAKTGNDAPNTKGSIVRAFFKLERDRDGNLNEDGLRWMGRLKTLLANILGGEDRVDADGELAPVSDDEVTPLIAASIVKGTEYRVSDMDDDKKLALMFEVATKPAKDGGLGMDSDTAATVIESGELNFADVSGIKLRCRARANEKGFVTLYWASYNPEGT